MLREFGRSGPWWLQTPKTVHAAAPSVKQQGDAARNLSSTNHAAPAQTWTLDTATGETFPAWEKSGLTYVWPIREGQ